MSDAPPSRPSLDDILHLERVGPRTFTGHPRSRGTRRTIFGGEVAAQATVAATRTEPRGRAIHSLHATFLAAGDPTRDLEHRVRELRDGRSFSTRRVDTWQGDRRIFTAVTSFHAREPGPEHGVAPPGGAPMPERSLSFPAVGDAGNEALARWASRFERHVPFEAKFAEMPQLAPSAPGTAHPQRIWLRARGPVPTSAELAPAVLTYASDLFLLAAALPQHGFTVGDGRVRIASLDHAVWFHAPIDPTDWLLYSLEARWAGDGRALCHGTFHDRDGTPVASVVQEGLVRPLGSTDVSSSGPRRRSGADADDRQEGECRDHLPTATGARPPA